MVGTARRRGRGRRMTNPHGRFTPLQAYWCYRCTRCRGWVDPDKAQVYDLILWTVCHVACWLRDKDEGVV